MPKYTNPKMTSFKEKGFMEFEHYPLFHERYENILTERDKHLATFLFFTGVSPRELIELQRRDVSREGDKIKFRITRIGKKTKERQPRFIEWSIKYPELISFWEWLKNWPDDFYIFGWLRIQGSGGGNPREYIRKHLGDCAYFFRHNINSLLYLSGATDQQVMEFKGAKSMWGVLPYRHLSQESLRKRTKIQSKAIK